MFALLHSSSSLRFLQMLFPDSAAASSPHLVQLFALLCMQHCLLALRPCTMTNFFQLAVKLQSVELQNAEVWHVAHLWGEKNMGVRQGRKAGGGFSCMIVSPRVGMERWSCGQCVGEEEEGKQSRAGTHVCCQGRFCSSGLQSGQIHARAAGSAPRTEGDIHIRPRLHSHTTVRRYPLSSCTFLADSSFFCHIYNGTI